jgi:hypothetical protein
MPIMDQFSGATKETAERAAIRRLVTSRQLRWALSLSVIPTIFFLVAFQLTKMSGPTWLSNNFENNYAYLFNSLLLVKGYAPSWVDHPGTTAEPFLASAYLSFSFSPSLSCGRAHPSRLRVHPDLMQIEVRLTVSP